jgi:hypothetical protein
VSIGGQTLTGPRSGLPHGGLLVDRRLDKEHESVTEWMLDIGDRGSYGAAAKWGRRRW